MKPTLGQVFTLSLLGLGVGLGLLFYVVFEASRAAALESAERSREAASREIGDRVTGFLAKAPEAVEQFQLALQRGLVEARDPAAMEPALFGPLLANGDISEVTLTYGVKTGFADGAIQLAAAPRGQWSVWRTGEARLMSRHVHQEGGGFVADRRVLERTARLGDLPTQREPGAAVDPTRHLTFLTPASEPYHGRLLWSDLHWSQLDSAKPAAERRVEVSVQQVVTDAAGGFVGVLRVGLLAPQLDRALKSPMTAAGAVDPHRIFICDPEGRLITRGESGDRMEEAGEDLRIPAKLVPEPIASALAEKKLRAVSEERPSLAGRFRLGGEVYLTTFRALPGTLDWVVGIVAPRSFYLGKLTAMRNRLLAIMLALTVVLVVGGSLVMRSVRRAQGQIVRESLRMNRFEFAPASTAAPFRDVSEVLESLEKAKSAMRAMGKYAPIDLVRRLYHEKSEPVLGGESMEVSIMFTDIKDFTTLSERLEPNALARALGHYLEVMARIIQQETRGIIDKYIGDAIMALWNVPEPVPEHARMACLAALRCREAGEALARSPEWEALPAFATRFGVHRETALVGHFGAPDRMNYTAVGDAVNLASRLEGLNKVYGTTIIVSESVVAEAGGEFEFRLLDRVAVKGKTQATRIFELCGRKGEVRPACIAAYEEALQAYFTRDFSRALGLLKGAEGDAPSDNLANRCRALVAEPPPLDWDGVYAVETK